MYRYFSPYYKYRGRILRYLILPSPPPTNAPSPTRPRLMPPAPSHQSPPRFPHPIQSLSLPLPPLTDYLLLSIDNIFIITNKYNDMIIAMITFKCIDLIIKNVIETK